MGEASFCEIRLRERTHPERAGPTSPDRHRGPGGPQLPWLLQAEWSPPQAPVCAVETTAPKGVGRIIDLHLDQGVNS